MTSPSTQTPASPQKATTKAPSPKEEGGIFLHYQPQVKIPNKTTTAFEALCRLTYPVQSPIPTEPFIANSEQSGEIVQLGRQVLALLKNDYPALLTKYPTIRISVNTSTTELYAPDFADHFSTWLNSLPTHAAHHLRLEVRKTSLMQLSDTALAHFHTLRSLGIYVAIDDLGTGQSNLARLHNLPFDIIKLDKRFIHLLDQPMVHEIVRWVIAFGQRFGKTVTAEGVETQSQLEALRTLGCDVAQGFLFGKPAPLTHWLALP
jgi:EAL domain-containing protein (putative c-di-GMP-specific phosphodiesterase class I)